MLKIYPSFILNYVSDTCIVDELIFF